MNRYVFVGGFLAVVLSCGGLLRADDAARPGPWQRTVTVQGLGKLEAAPDIARLSVGVTEDGTDPERTAAHVREITRHYLDVVKAQGIPEKDIQTQYYNLQPKYDYTHGSPKRTGYSVATSVAVIVRDLTKVGRVMGALPAAGATNISGPSFDFDKPAELEKKTLALAVADAKAKAEILAQASGATLGPVLTLQQEGPINPPTPRRFRPVAMAALAVTSEQPVETGEQSFSSTVSATFALK